MTFQVSVVIPTYRRPALLGCCLAAVREQSLAPDRYEIIVVDDGRDPDTHALVARAAAQTLPSVRYIRQSCRQGPAAARNRGWRAARAPFVAFTDDDTVPARDWLASGLAALAPGIDAAWGRVIVPLPSAPTDYEVDASRLAHAGFVTANCFCRRRALESAGGFDERFTLAWREDSDLLFSLLVRNGEVVHVPEARVVHPLRRAPWGVSLSQQRKAAFNALLYKKHRRLYRERIQPRPPWGYYAAVTALVTAFAGAPVSPVLLAAGLVVWLGLTVGLCCRRLAGTSRAVAHVLEMIVTSALIPPLAVYWRLYGAFKYRVFFL